MLWRCYNPATITQKDTPCVKRISGMLELMWMPPSTSHAPIQRRHIQKESILHAGMLSPFKLFDNRPTFQRHHGQNTPILRFGMEESEYIPRTHVL